MSDRFRISRMLAQQLHDLKVPVSAVLRHAGLPDGFFHQERILVDTDEFFALWRAIEIASDDPAIGLKLGADMSLEAGTPQTIAALHSQSFLDAVQRMARYKKLICPEEIRLHRSRDECAVEFVFLLGKQLEPQALIDTCLSCTLNIGRRGTGVQLFPLRLELTRKPQHRTLLETHFGCRVKFQAARNLLVFRCSDLDRPFTTYNPDMLAFLAPQLDAELDERQASRSFGDEVKAVLKRLISGRRPTIADAAQAMRLSVRTLQRRLTEQGVTFQHLLQEARHDLARHYLGQSRMELTETAYLLGFDDANSFFRAFHRWEGTSPHRWRTRQQSCSSTPVYS